MKAKLERFNRHWMPEPFSGCWLWTSAVRYRNYGAFHFKGLLLSATRESWELFKGEIPDGLCVLHKCDTPLCVNPDHLFLGSKSDNNIDCALKGRNSAKLTAVQVTGIRNLLDRGFSNLELAKRYGVDPSNISHIKRRKSWRYVDACD